jgi:hypothetical protein
VNKTIQKMQLAGNGLEERAAQHLADFLLVHTGLKSLDLSYNQLNDVAGNTWPERLWDMSSSFSGGSKGGDWRDHSQYLPENILAGFLLFTPALSILCHSSHTEFFFGSTGV